MARCLTSKMREKRPDGSRDPVRSRHRPNWSSGPVCRVRWAITLTSMLLRLRDIKSSRLGTRSRTRYGRDRALERAV